jgi:adenine C2-methylase RlmN of 23S rRNA A2503 and tRNA A37
MKIEKVLYLNSGRIFLIRLNDGYLIECTEMQDVLLSGKNNIEVRESVDPHIIWKHLSPHNDKWLLTVSTQRGCIYNCKFCDVANLPYNGNLSQGEIEQQIKFILENTPYVTESKKVKIGFARMGEPAKNLNNVLGAMSNLYKISNEYNCNFIWLPCFNSILPKVEGADVIDEVLEIKEKIFSGNLHFQISCNSTDEAKRKELFGNAEVLSIPTIIKYINSKNITKRTITLNFIVMDGIEIDIKKLKSMGINGDKFTIKLIPLNNTNNAENHKLKTYANYKNYEKLVLLGDEFKKMGIPVVIDAIAKCEEAGLCCGQLAQIYL